MDLDKNGLNWILDKLVEYSKYMKIEPIPILTINPTEVIKAVHDCIPRYNAVNRRLKQDNYFGFCLYHDIFDNVEHNAIIYLNIKAFKRLTGLHEIKDLGTYEDYKYGFRRVFRQSKKIGHIEETLIHELLHIKLRQSKHTKKFNNTVKMIYNDVNKTKQIYTS